eukprot:g11265.t1
MEDGIETNTNNCGGASSVFRSPATVFLQGLLFDRTVDQIGRRIQGGRGGGAIPIPMAMRGGDGGEGEEGAEGVGVGAEGVGVGNAASAEATQAGGAGEAGDTERGLFRGNMTGRTPQKTGGTGGSGTICKGREVV